MSTESKQREKAISGRTAGPINRGKESFQPCFLHCVTLIVLQVNHINNKFETTKHF